MPTTITELAQFTGPIAMPNPGDPAAAAQLRDDVIEHLANRSRFVFLDAMGARVADLSQHTIAAVVGRFAKVISGFPQTSQALITFSDGQHIYTSSTGSSWTSRTPGASAGANLQDGVVGGGVAVICGQVSTNGFHRSTDGISWTGYAPGGGGTGNFYAIAYGGGTFVAVGIKTGPTVWIQTSTDGITWTDRTHSIAATTSPTSVVYHQGRFVLAVRRNDLSGVEIWTSVSGTTWTLSTTITTTLGSNAGEKLQASATRLVVPARDKIYYSDDIGATWTEYTVPAGPAGGSFDPLVTGYARGLYVVYGKRSSTSECWISDNGSEWFQVDGVESMNNATGTMTYVQGRWWIRAPVDGVMYRSSRSVNI